MATQSMLMLSGWRTPGLRADKEMQQVLGYMSGSVGSKFQFLQMHVGMLQLIRFLFPVRLATTRAAHARMGEIRSDELQKFVDA